MVKEDIHHLKKVLDRNSEKYILQLFEEDQDDVRRFMNDLLSQSLSPGRVVKYLYSLVIIKRRLNISFRAAKEDDIRRFIIELEQSEYADWTKRDIKIFIKKYFNWLGKENLIGWLRIKSVKNKKLPEEILTEDDIKSIAKAAYTSRDKAFVLSLYESGCRIEEILPLRMKHLSFDRLGATLMVRGKKGERRIRLVASVLTLQKWKEDHPRQNDPESYLWCKIPAIPVISGAHMRKKRKLLSRSSINTTYNVYENHNKWPLSCMRF